jgi:hypothetical protein
VEQGEALRGFGFQGILNCEAFEAISVMKMLVNDVLW